MLDEGYAIGTPSLERSDLDQVIFNNQHETASEHTILAHNLLSTVTRGGSCCAELCGDIVNATSTFLLVK